MTSRAAQQPPPSSPTLLTGKILCSGLQNGLFSFDIISHNIYKVTILDKIVGIFVSAGKLKQNMWNYLVIAEEFVFVLFVAIKAPDSYVETTQFHFQGRMDLVLFQQDLALF